MLNRIKKTRLHLYSIKETTSNRLDDEIGELFRQMRVATNLSQQQIASQFDTSLQTIEFLESGHLSALPPWKETKRVIVDYTTLLGLDPEPVLRRVMLQLPGDHSKNSRTLEYVPSYDNMRANADAIMNRVPGWQTPVESAYLTRKLESSSSSRQQQVEVGLEQSQPAARSSQSSSGYGDMLAIPQDSTRSRGKSPTRMVAKKRETSVFVPLVQLLLLLIILTTGYMTWLGVNDPQGFEELKTLAIRSWQLLVEQVWVWIEP